MGVVSLRAMCTNFVNSLMLGRRGEVWGAESDTDKLVVIWK